MKCELLLFIDKIKAVRAKITAPSMFLSISTESSAVFNQFELLSLASLREIIVKMRLSSGGMDIVPPCLLKDYFETIGPKIIEIINSSLASGDVTKSFKHAVVKPVIKNVIWDHPFLLILDSSRNLHFFPNYWRRLCLDNCIHFYIYMVFMKCFSLVLNLSIVQKLHC